MKKPPASQPVPVGSSGEPWHPDPEWRAAFEVLRAEVDGEMHLARGLHEAPPYQFVWWSSPDCQQSGFVHRGALLRHGGGLEAFRAYANAVGLADHLEWDAYLVGLLRFFDALPRPGFKTPGSFESEGSDHPPRIDRDGDALRVTLTYIDSRPLDAAVERALMLGRGEVEGDWVSVDVVALCPHHRMTVLVGGDTPWSDTVERIEVRSQVSVAASRRRGARRRLGLLAGSAVVLGSIAVLAAWMWVG